MFGICTKNKKTSRKVALHTTTFYNLPPLIFYLFQPLDSKRNKNDFSHFFFA